ncbi:hypothetical protein H4R20_005305 [Coemansia guatemalensis]|uniref:Transcription factor TFIIB cyclin-like domain-containing protein n=1 Tax=Coemansia guatemalensis TaxID=2761395 RepID=A0A9W8HUH3_9FUNG|nr:hypothetical protein H4R20_005305 [Coemansia guatemalensis]
MAQSTFSFAAVAGRMNVNTLLNPVSVTPRLVPLHAQSVPGRTPTQVYCVPGLHPCSKTIGGSVTGGGGEAAIHACYRHYQRKRQRKSHELATTKAYADRRALQTANSDDSFEKALWRQESGLGPPTPTDDSCCSSECIATAQDNPDTAKEHYIDAHQPHVFVPVPPLVGYSALSKVRSSDHIATPRPKDNDSMVFIYDSSKGVATVPHSLCCTGSDSALAFCSESLCLLDADNGADLLPSAKRARLDAADVAMPVSGCDARDSYDDDNDTASVASSVSARMSELSQPSADADENEESTVYDRSYSNVISISDDVPLMAALPPPAPLSPAPSASAEHETISRAETSALKRSAKGKAQRAACDGEKAVTSPDTPAAEDSASDAGSSSNKGAEDEALADILDKEKPLVDWQALEVPVSIWDEAQMLYDRVKTLKKVQSRQPVRKKHVILAALMFILCRNKNYPRTFAEICAAANVTKREIGMYYNLMRQVLGREYTSIQRAKPLEFLHRWCAVLELPQWVAKAAALVHERADERAIVQGKCPISVSAASMWLVIWCFNHRHALHEMGFAPPDNTAVNSNAVPCIPGLGVSPIVLMVDQRDVCKAASVVVATLSGVFKQLFPELKYLINGLLDNHL